MFTARCPFRSPPWLSFVQLLADRSLCDQVCEPTVWPAAATCLRISGCQVGVLADREEHRLGALVGQRLEHRRRIVRPRAVVEGQHHFVVAQEIEA